MKTERTPQELFKLMLDNWDNINASFICIKIDRMFSDDYISFNEHCLMNKFLSNHRNKAIKDFEAGQYFAWWKPEEQRLRKQFVKYLSEII
jgi:hypothetical protein